MSSPACPGNHASLMLTSAQDRLSPAVSQIIRSGAVGATLMVVLLVPRLLTAKGGDRKGRPTSCKRAVFYRFTTSREDARDHLAGCVRQAVVAAEEVERQLLVVDAQQV